MYNKPEPRWLTCLGLCGPESPLVTGTPGVLLPLGSISTCFLACPSPRDKPEQWGSHRLGQKIRVPGLVQSVQTQSSPLSTQMLGGLNGLSIHSFQVYIYADVLACVRVVILVEGFLQTQMESFGPHLGGPLFKASTCDGEGVATWAALQHPFWRQFLHLVCSKSVRAECVPETTHGSLLLSVVFGEWPEVWAVT